MQGIQSTTPHFAGNINKRLKQHHKHYAIQVQKSQKQSYNSALEAYSANPEAYDAFLNKAIYTDHEGPFTGRDLLEALQNKVRNEKIGYGMAVGLCAVMVVPLLLFLDPEVRKFNVKEYDFVAKFVDPVQPAVRAGLAEMRDLGLVEYRDTGKIKGLTKLGTQLLNAHK